MRNFGIQTLLLSVLVSCPLVFSKANHDHGDYIDLMPAYSVRMNAGDPWELKANYSKD